MSGLSARLSTRKVAGQQLDTVSIGFFSQLIGADGVSPRNLLSRLYQVNVIRH